jgi:hypothetical protein
VLLVPTAVLSVVLKVVRLAQVPATGPWWTRPADLVSDLTFSAAWIVGWWVLAVAGSRRLTRALVLAAAQLSTWAWSVLLVVYPEYWMRTGNTLTLDRLMARGGGGTTCRGCSAPSSRRGRWPCWPGDPRVHGVADGAGRARSRRAGSVVGPSRPGADHPAARLPTVGRWARTYRVVVGLAAALGLARRPPTRKLPTCLVQRRWPVAGSPAFAVRMALSTSGALSRDAAAGNGYWTATLETAPRPGDGVQVDDDWASGVDSDQE